MAECYSCGARIPAGEGHRRRMKIGASRDMFGLNWRYYYADQLLCNDCSAQKDWNRILLAALLMVMALVAYTWWR